MSQKTLYIHIGMGKTGTSALQDFFTCNRDVLKNTGITYPCQSMLPAQHRLAQSLLKEKIGAWWFPKNLLSYQQEWEAILSQVDTPKALLSSEIFYQCETEEILRIREILSSYNVKIIIYLRRQDTALQSAYNQAVKATGLKFMPEKFMSNQKRFDYDRILNMWSESFGKENIVVRPYERQQFHNGNIFADFLRNSLGLDLTDQYQLPQGDVNSRLHRVVLEYKRCVNCLPLSPKTINSIIPFLLLISEEYKQIKKDVSIISPQDQMAIIQEYASINESVARLYCNRPDGSLFHDSFPDLAMDWKPYNSLLEEDARRINSRLIESCADMVKTIQQGIGDALESNDHNAQEASWKLSPGLYPVSRYSDINSRTCDIHFQRENVDVSRNELYIHIGTHKTGTTALQEFFAKNRVVLKSKGVVYPVEPDGRDKHQRLAWGLVRGVKPPRNSCFKPFKGYEKEWQFILGQDAPKMLISSEVFYKCSKDDIREIRRLTEGYRIVIIIYLRRQDLISESVYNQITKDSRRIWTRFDDIPFKLDYYNILSQWSKVFGRENIIVRPYEKRQFYKGTIYADFLHHVFKEELAEEFYIPKGNINPRLHSIPLEYKRLVNHLSFSRNTMKKIKEILMELSDRYRAEGRLDFQLLSPEMRYDVFRRFKDSNESVAREYLLREDGMLFYDSPFDECDVTIASESPSPENIQEINQYIAVKYPRVFSVILQAILDANSSESLEVKNSAYVLSTGVTLHEIKKYFVKKLKA